MTERTIAPLGSADDSNMRRISNSEVATWLTCKRKYYYEFDLNLEPKVSSGALGKGTLLHEGLALYYASLKEWDEGAGTPGDPAGVTRRHESAVNRARTMLQNFLASGNGYDFETVMEVDRLLQGYWNFYQGDPNWEILEVEKGYDLAMTEDYEYSLRLDLLVRERNTGAIVLVDHKTAYDFWTEDDLDLNPQFPKYIGSLRANGVNVDKAVLNQIRTRSIKAPTLDQLFRRTVCKPNLAKIGNAMREQVISSMDIMKHRNLPLEVKDQNSVRILSKQVCKFCNVKSLCLAEYDGGDITVAKETDFRQRTYGYNPTDNETAAL